MTCKFAESAGSSVDCVTSIRINGSGTVCNECVPRLLLNGYQNAASRTLRFNNEREGLTLAGLGITGEGGEVADIIKKHLFHNKALDRNHLIEEIGDVLWYVAAACTVLGVDLAEVADRNIAKLLARYPDKGPSA